MPRITKPPASESRQSNILLVTVSPNQEDRRYLASILDAPGWTIRGAASLAEALRLLKQKPRLIVCERELPDGNWRDLLRQASQMDDPPAVIVSTPSADRRFWAEVINLGAFDVLMKPFENNEVRQVLGMATRHQPAAAFSVA